MKSKFDSFIFKKLTVVALIRSNALSILFILILPLNLLAKNSGLQEDRISVAEHTRQHNHNKKQKSKNLIGPSSSSKVFLSGRQFAALSTERKVKYLFIAQNYISTLEILQNKLLGENNQAQNDQFSIFYSLLIPSSLAASSKAASPQPGADCLIGGHIATYKMNPKTRRLSCRPEVKDEDKVFCGSGTSKQVRCNPIFYGYDNNSQGFCVDITPTLSKTCQSKFQNRYKNLSEAEIKVDLDKMASSSDSRIVNAFESRVQKIHKQVRQNTSTDGSEPLQATQREAANFVSQTIRPTLQTQSAADANPQNIQPSVAADKAKNSDKGPDTTKSPLYAMACVKEGLAKSGITDVSDRYLTLVGMGIQAGNGGRINVNNPTERNTFYQRAAQVIQAYGVCPQSAYDDANNYNRLRLSLNRQLRTQEKTISLVLGGSVVLPAEEQFVVIPSLDRQSNASFTKYDQTTHGNADTPLKYAGCSSNSSSTEDGACTEENGIDLLSTQFGIAKADIRKRGVPFNLFPQSAGDWEAWEKQTAVERQENWFRKNASDVSVTSNIDFGGRRGVEMGAAHAFGFCVKDVDDQQTSKGSPFDFRRLHGSKSSNWYSFAAFQSKGNEVRKNSQTLCENISTACHVDAGSQSFCQDVDSKPKQQYQNGSGQNGGTSTSNTTK